GHSRGRGARADGKAGRHVWQDVAYVAHGSCPGAAYRDADADDGLYRRASSGSETDRSTRSALRSVDGAKARAALGHSLSAHRSGSGCLAAGHRAAAAVDGPQERSVTRVRASIFQLIAYGFYPAWLIAGGIDYWCHRHSSIERTSGVVESLYHVAQL